MIRIKIWLWNWLFADFAKHCDERVNAFLKQKSDDFGAEFQAWMRESRENMKDDIINTERRHKELVAAIEGLRK